MNTKQAIEFFEKVISCIKSADFIYIRQLDDERFREIIELLKCGEENEKYKKIVEGLINNYGSNKVIFGFGAPETLKHAIEHLKWIYLVKEK